MLSKYNSRSQVLTMQHQDLWTRLTNLEARCERHTHYGGLWHVGMNALKAAQETPDKQNYLQSGYAFIKAIKAIHARPEAWLGLSYLLYLLGDEASALYYTRQVLAAEPEMAEARELQELLASSLQLNQLMDSVSEMGVSDWVERPPERLSESEIQEILHQAQALLQIQHLLITYEIDQGKLQRLDELRQRQDCLEQLCELLRPRLAHFSQDRRWGPVFAGLFAAIDSDMLSLRQLELLFEAMQSFQKEVHGLFAELTRRTLRLRVQGAKELGDNQRFLLELVGRLEQLTIRLSAWPVHLRAQAESSSGWAHMLQQTRQFQQALSELAASTT